MYLCDYHVHSDFSEDGTSPMAEICQRAIELGVKELGFADHIDFFPGDKGWGYFDYQAYAAGIREVRERFGEKLIIRKGLEVDYQREFESDMRRELQDISFDFVIGSVHYSAHRYIDAVSLSGLPLSTIYGEYIAELQASIKSGLFDIIGHLDYVRRQLREIHQPVDFDAYLPPLREVIKEALDADMVIEINFRHHQEGRPILPPLKLLEEYGRCGGKSVVISSDTHQVEELGRGLRYAISLAQRAGIRFLATYENRTCRPVPIE